LFFITLGLLILQSKLRVTNKKPIFFFFLGSLLFLMSMMLSFFGAEDKLMVFKAVFKWGEIFMICMGIFLVCSSQNKFEIVYSFLAIIFGLDIFIAITSLIGLSTIYWYRFLALIPGYDCLLLLGLSLPHIKQHWLIRIICIACALLAFLSLSRGVWLGLFALGIYWLYQLRALRPTVLSIAAVIVGLITLVNIYPEIWGTILGRFAFESASNKERIGMALIAWDAFVHHPATGIGAENFARYMLRDGVPSFVSAAKPEVLTPHNFFLQVLSETGIFGAFSLAIWLGATYRILFKTSTASSISWLLGLKMEFIVLLIIFLFGYISGEMRMTFGLYLGLVLASQRAFGNGNQIDRSGSGLELNNKDLIDSGEERVD
jgi:O-antigen ligase